MRPSVIIECVIELAFSISCLRREELVVSEAALGRIRPAWGSLGISDNYAVAVESLVAANDMLALLLDIVLDIDQCVDFVFDLSGFLGREESTGTLSSCEFAHGGLFDDFWLEARIPGQDVLHGV